MAASLLITLAGCAPPTAPVTGTPSAAETQPSASVADCRITIGRAGTQPPAPFNPDVLPVSYVDTWFGNDAIWIRLPKGGVIPASPDPGKSRISAKFPWWRVLAGQLQVSTSRVGSEKRIEAGVATVAEYGQTGFVPSGLVFDGAGCWQITGSLQGQSLTFIAFVELRGS
jgi:hypothetical protein